MPREIDEAWIEKAIERYRRLDELRTEYVQVLQSQVVSVQSPDGTVEVLVTAAGDITEVRIVGSLHNRNPAELSREVQAVVTNAADAAHWARAKLRDEIFGADRAIGEP